MTFIRFEKRHLFGAVVIVASLTSCNNTATDQAVERKDSVVAEGTKKKEPISQPLISHIYTADPSAHIFNDHIYIYPSHDTATGTPDNNDAGHFDMMDFHVLSMDSIGGKVTDHGVALDIKNIPWA